MVKNADKKYDLSTMENLPGMHHMMKMDFTDESPTCVHVKMPITPEICQPFGFVHGGATISLLESAASRAGDLGMNPDFERSFGLEVHIRHRKPGEGSFLYGVAELDHEEKDKSGKKQFWKVAATDDEGDVVSDGTVVTKTVSLAYLDKKERTRAADKAGE